MSKFRKLLLVSLISVCAFMLGALVFSACTEHVHAFGEWQTETAATCSQEGKEVRRCECGQTETRPTAKKEHTPDQTAWQTVTAATCSQKGLESSVCTLCRAPVTRETEMLPHSYGEWRETKAPTCSAAGLKEHDCTVCGHGESEEIQKLPHTPVVMVAKAPTCTEAGYTAGEKCGVCGATVSGMEAIPPTGHSYGDWQEVAKATCTSKGVEQRECAKCFNTEERETAMTPHSLETVQGEQPTCTEPGHSDGKRCTVCEQMIVEQKVLPALGHKMSEYTHQEDTSMGHYHTSNCIRCMAVEVRAECNFNTVETPATCLTPLHHTHTCTTCNYFYEHDEGEALGHSWLEPVFYKFDENKVPMHIQRCARADGDEEHEAIIENCTQVLTTYQPDCKNAGYTRHECEKCNLWYSGEKVPALGHDFTPYVQEAGARGTYTHTHRCQNDGCGLVETKECIFLLSQTVDPTCTTQGYTDRTCVVCRNTARTNIKEKLGHITESWEHFEDDGQSYHRSQCLRKDCGETVVGECNFVDASVAPTCGVAGHDLEICEVCLYNKDNGVIEALVHAFSPWTPDGFHKQHVHTCSNCGLEERVDHPYDVATVEATCISEGSKTYTCDECGDTYTDIYLNPLGHSFENMDPSLWNINPQQHAATCVRCENHVELAHNFTESNICADCGFDGLYYAYGDESRTWATVREPDANDKDENGIAYPTDSVNNSKRLLIAASWNSVPVTQIGKNAFFASAIETLAVREVVLPYCVESIENFAFDHCIYLESVSIADDPQAAILTYEKPAALRSIGEYAFQNCSALTTAHLPDSLISIGRSAFINCTSLNDISIPESVTQIGGSAFQNTAFINNPAKWTAGALYINKHLIKVDSGTIAEDYEIWDKTLTVSENAFENCTALKRLTIPASVTVFDNDAFKGCTSLSTVVYNGTAEQFLAIKFGNDLASPMHYASSITIAGAVGDMQIGEGVTAIPAGAFRGSQISSIIIPESVTSIGANAFYGCESLTHIEVLGKIVRLGADAFTGTGYYNDLENWTNGLLYIGDMLIAADRQQTGDEIDIREGVTAIAPGVFKNFATLKKVNLPASLMFIGSEAFSGAFEVTTSPSGARVVNAEVTFNGSNGYWFASNLNGMGRVLMDEKFASNKSINASELMTYNGEWRRTVKN